MKDLDENDVMFSMGEGCRLHGDEAMRECSLCGSEYCGKCHPGRPICPDCLSGGEEDDDSDDEIFEDPDVAGLILQADEEAEDDAAPVKPPRPPAPRGKPPSRCKPARPAPRKSRRR